MGEGWDGGLHAHLDRLPRAEGDVGEELGRGGRAQVYDGFGGVGEYFLAVVVFEDFVEAIFSCALEAIADECGTPAEEDAAEAFFSEDFGPALKVGFVHFGVDLAAAFYQIERGDGGVRGTAG